LLMNRVIWSGIALALFGLTVVLFKPQRAGTARQVFGKKKQLAASHATAPVSARLTPVKPIFTGSTAWSQCLAILRFDVKTTLKSVPFLVMLLLAIGNLFANISIGGLRIDSTPYAMTSIMLEQLTGGFNIMLTFVLIFYAGELIFKERQTKIADVVDAMPMPNWAPMVA
jgi:ABC-2 type transport system permease protein